MINELKLGNYMRTLLLILGLLALIFALLSAWFEKNIAASISIISFLTFMFYAFIDKISKFKAGVTGFEAETKDVVQEAKHTIKEMQILGKKTILLLISIIQRMGRFDSGFSFIDRDNIKRDMAQLLYDLNFSKEHINEAFKNSDWYKYCIIDYVLKVMHLVSDDEISKKYDLLYINGTPDISAFNNFINELELFTNKSHKMTNEIQEWIDDYRYFVENAEHRNLEKWESTI